VMRGMLYYLHVMTVLMFEWDAILCSGRNRPYISRKQQPVARHVKTGSLPRSGVVELWHRSYITLG
jgi:hypothetical protein